MQFRTPLDMNRQTQKLTPFSKVIFTLCFLMFVGGAVSLFFVEGDAAVSRLLFQMLELFVMMVVIFIPRILNRMVHIKVPMAMDIIFVAFCFGTMILGDVADLYGKIPWWDKMQHGISGVLLGILAYEIINTFNKVDGKEIRFPPLFVAIWMVCFALAVGAFWEIWEYVTDGLFGFNSQQYLSTRGTFDNSVPLVGHEALKDTMQDLMLDLLGSGVIAIVSFFLLRKQRKNLNDK